MNELRDPPHPCTAVVRTVVFTDVVGSTRTMEAMGDAAWLRLLQHHTRTTLAVSSSHRGEVIHFVGDGHMVVFEQPDDAVACALRLRLAFDIQAELGIRLGMCQGSVLPFGDGSFVGMTVNLAARFTDLCRPGQVVMSDATYLDARQAIALPSVELTLASVKGVQRPVPIRVLSGGADPWT